MIKVSVQILVLGVTFFLAACSPQPTLQTGKLPGDDDALKKASWLLGEWRNAMKRGFMYESWERTNDSTYTGGSYVVIQGDTVSSEVIDLAAKDGRLYYIPTVKNQNAGQPVVFTEKQVSKDLLVFENTEHDFPQRITYRKITIDSLVAEISGVENGKQKSIQFPMARVR
jgi:hypothetical protein